MQSPPLELALDIAHVAGRNLLRARGDADEDTISEITRCLVRTTPHGRLLFSVAIFAAAECFRRHILNPLKES